MQNTKSSAKSWKILYEWGVRKTVYIIPLIFLLFSIWVALNTNRIILEYYGEPAWFTEYMVPIVIFAFSARKLLRHWKTRITVSDKKISFSDEKSNKVDLFYKKIESVWTKGDHLIIAWVSGKNRKLKTLDNIEKIKETIDEQLAK